MSDRPEQTPEGALLARAMKRIGRTATARALAPDAELTEGRWRQIVNGYQPVGNGRTIPVKAPAETLARMARVLGITPDQLAEVGRQDAAEELLELGQSGEVGNSPKPAASPPPADRTPIEDAERLILDSALPNTEKLRWIARLHAEREDFERGRAQRARELIEMWSTQKGA